MKDGSKNKTDAGIEDREDRIKDGRREEIKS